MEFQLEERMDNDFQFQTHSNKYVIKSNYCDENLIYKSIEEAQKCTDDDLDMESFEESLLE